jgi:hypothetical protein
MRGGTFLLHAAGLVVAITVGCGGKLADDGSDGGALDSRAPAPTCSRDSECVNQCGEGQLCCCDSVSSTCFSPESGECGGSESTPEASTSTEDPPI